MVVFLKVKADNGMGQVGTQTGTIGPCFHVFKIGRSIVYKMHFILFCFKIGFVRSFRYFVAIDKNKI